jgi:hypothetical protein
MNPLQTTELILLILEKGIPAVRAAIDAFSPDETVTYEKLVERINSVAPAWEKDDDPTLPIEPDED